MQNSDGLDALSAAGGVLALLDAVRDLIAVVKELIEEVRGEDDSDYVEESD